MMKSCGETFANFLFLFIAAWCACACACETVLTHAEIASAERARAVEFFGTPAPNAFGWVVNAAGNVNGDGFDDFVAAAPYEDVNAGAVYLIFGRSAEAWASAQFDFSAADTPDSSSWIRISGGASYNFLGYNGIAHGDFNGDGISDILLSTTVAKTFCVFGHHGAWSSFNTTQIESGDVSGFAIQSGGSCLSVGNAGDMNSDGIEDLLVSDDSASRVIFGVAGDNRSTFIINTLDGSNGFSLVDGTSYLGSGYAFGSVGDINGDGFADLAIGSYRAGSSSDSGRAYILFARNASASGKQWPISLDLPSFLDGMNGFIVDGQPDSLLGRSVVGAGDVNGDGFADIFIGTDSATWGAWIVFGHPAPWASPLNASLLDGTNGFRLNSGTSDSWGHSGGGAGDVDGDGFDDIIIGGYNALNSSGTKTGMAAIVFGHRGSWPAELDRNEVRSGSVGFLIDGPAASSEFGLSAQGAGDVNGDGLADVVVGARFFGSGQGYAALVFGTDDHCAVCSNHTEECLLCDDGFVLNGTICEASQFSSSQFPAFASSSSASQSSVGSLSFSVVVVIETGGGSGTVNEVAAEIAQLLGVDVGQISVVEITPGTFEVTVINEEVAQQLVDLVEKCIEEAESAQ